LNEALDVMFVCSGVEVLQSF